MKHQEEKKDLLVLDIHSPLDLTAPELQIILEKCIHDKNILKKIEFKKKSTERAGGTVLVTVITVSGTVIVALITALMKIIHVTKTKQITFKKKKGESVLIIPADTPPEKYEDYLKILEKMGKLDIYIE